MSDKVVALLAFVMIVGSIYVYHQIYRLRQEKRLGEWIRTFDPILMFLTNNTHTVSKTCIAPSQRDISILNGKLANMLKEEESTDYAISAVAELNEYSKDRYRFFAFRVKREARLEDFSKDDLRVLALHLIRDELDLNYDVFINNIEIVPGVHRVPQLSQVT